MIYCYYLNIELFITYMVSALDNKSNINSADKNKVMDALGSPPVPVCNTEANRVYVITIALFWMFACECDRPRRSARGLKPNRKYQ